VYSLLLRLYPRSHRDTYGQQMLHMVEDMLDDAVSTQGRVSVWARIITDLPLSVCKEHLETLGENMQTRSNNHIIKYGAMTALLIALIGAGFPLANKLTVAIGAADTSLRFPTPMQGFLFPVIALLVAGVTLLIYRASSAQQQVPASRLWLIAAVMGTAAVSIAVLGFDALKR
jgi:hypothetical protein